MLSLIPAGVLVLKVLQAVEAVVAEGQGTCIYIVSRTQIMGVHSRSQAGQAQVQTAVTQGMGGQGPLAFDKLTFTPRGIHGIF